MFAPAVLSLRLFLLKKNRRWAVIAVVAIALFLVGTRNLMLDLRCALADIVLSLRLDPWSWPGMTVSFVPVVFCG